WNTEPSPLVEDKAGVVCSRVICARCMSIALSSFFSAACVCRISGRSAGTARSHCCRGALQRVEYLLAATQPGLEFGLPRRWRLVGPKPAMEHPGHLGQHTGVERVGLGQL